MKCRWIVALAALTGASACTQIETVYVPYETGYRRESRPSRPADTLEVVSGAYEASPPFSCSGVRCRRDKARVIGFFKIKNADGASAAQLLRKLESDAAEAGCDVLDVYPPGTIDAAGELRGRPRAGTCLLVHKTSLFQDFAAKLPRCPAGQTGVAIDRLGGGADREISVRGILTYDQTAPSCEVNGEACNCCRDCSLPLVLADPGLAGVSRAAPVQLMESGDDASLSVIPGTDAHAMGLTFGECERPDVVREGDRADAIVTGVLRHLAPAQQRSEWAIEAPSLCVVDSGPGRPATAPPPARGESDCENIISEHPSSFEAEECMFADYPESLPICPATLSSISVDEATAARHLPGDPVAVRGRIVTTRARRTAMDCGDERCCNRSSFDFGLIGPEKRVLDLRAWAQSPKFNLDCSPAAAHWMGTLVVAVTGVWVEEPATNKLVLEANDTCRLK